MTDPGSSIINLRSSVEYHWYKLLAEPDGELLISRDDYAVRFPELKQARSGFLWDFSDVRKTHHWDAQIMIGATTINDFGNQKLLVMTDKVKSAIDHTMYMPVFDYTGGEPTNRVNTLVFIGPIKWPPIFKESNDFKTSMFTVGVKFAQNRLA